MKWQLHVFILALLTVPSLQQSSSSNTRFDPDDADAFIATCSIPKYQQEGSSYVPPDTSTCAPFQDGESWASSLAADANIIQQLAVAYAPVLFFHPLEEYTLETVDATFRDPAAGRILFDARTSDAEVFDETLNQTAMLLTSRDFKLGLNKDRYSFGRDQTKSYQAGAGFDETTGQSISRAPIYYNAFEYDDAAIVINYHFYYTFHGSATFGVIGSYLNETYYTSFETVPFGAHEGDWQGMSIMVCKSAVDQFLIPSTVDSTASPSISPVVPLSVAYKQYESREVMDCTTGECTFYKDTTRPVGFVARGTHATYPVTATNLVYTELDVEFFVNLQGVLAVDKTNFKASDGSYRIFQPNATNVVKYLDPADVDFNTVPESEYFQAFGGRWGCSCENEDRDLELNFTDPGPSECFSAEGTAYVPCPTMSSVSTYSTFGLVQQLLGVIGAFGEAIIENARALIGNVREFFSTQSPFGPATFPEFSRWLAPTNAPVRKQMDDPTDTAEVYCQKLVEISDVYRTPVQFDTVALQNNVYGLIAFACFVVLMTIIVYTHPRFSSMRNARPLISMDEQTGVAQKLDRTTAILIIGPAIGYLIFYVCTMVGVAIYFTGFPGLVNRLEDTMGMDVDAIRALSYLFGLAVIIIDTAMVVFIFFPTRTVWQQVNLAYYDLIGDDEMVEQYRKRICCGSSAALVAFHSMYGILFNSLILSVLTVLIGCVYVGMAYAIGEICVDVFGALDNACLNLQAWGIIVQCGPDFHGFCNQWASSDSIITLWGSFIIVAGHYYLIGEAGAASKTFRYVPSSLLLLPSRKVYLARIARLAAANADSKDETSRTACLETGIARDDTQTGEDNGNGEDNEHKSGTDTDAAELEDAQDDDPEQLVYRATSKLTLLDAMDVDAAQAK
jgi:hypothetical protein